MCGLSTRLATPAGGASGSRSDPVQAAVPELPQRANLAGVRELNGTRGLARLAGRADAAEMALRFKQRKLLLPQLRAKGTSIEAHGGLMHPWGSWIDGGALCKPQGN